VKGLRGEKGLAAKRFRKDLEMSYASRGDSKEFRDNRAPSPGVGSQSCQRVSAFSFGKVHLGSDRSETVRFFVMQFRIANRVKSKDLASLPQGKGSDLQPPTNENLLREDSEKLKSELSRQLPEATSRE